MNRNSSSGGSSDGDNEGTASNNDREVTKVVKSSGNVQCVQKFVENYSENVQKWPNFGSLTLIFERTVSDDDGSDDDDDDDEDDFDDMEAIEMNCDEDGELGDGELGDDEDDDNDYVSNRSLWWWVRSDWEKSRFTKSHVF